jgi:hypothetical protein
MELVSELGKKSVVKIYSGESLTFRAREKYDGLGGLFTGAAHLYDVTFTLRKWPIIRQDAVGIVKGANRPIVREEKPAERLWGTPPPSFTIEGGGVGRYKLTATKKGFAPVEVLVNLASFRLDNIDGVLNERLYSASFDVLLTDPEEKRRSIPLLVESLDMDGRLVDMRKDVVLAPVVLEMDEYRSSRRIKISSYTLESFMERVKRAKEDPVPREFYDQKALRIVEGGMIRVSFRNVQAIYPVPLGY